MQMDVKNPEITLTSFFFSSEETGTWKGHKRFLVLLIEAVYLATNIAKDISNSLLNQSIKILSRLNKEAKGRVKISIEGIKMKL